MKLLLTKIKELQDSVSPAVKKIYSNKGRNQAESIRNKALEELESGVALEESDPELDELFQATSPEVETRENSTVSGISNENTSSDGDSEVGGTKRLEKGDMINYLEKKQKVGLNSSPCRGWIIKAHCIHLFSYRGNLISNGMSSKLGSWRPRIVVWNSKFNETRQKRIPMKGQKLQTYWSSFSTKTR